MRAKRVYLAGHFNNSWERKAKEALEANEISAYYARNNLLDSYFDVDTEQEAQRLKRNIEKQNLMNLRYCDIILFNFKDAGSCFELITELAYAYKENKIIIGFDANSNDSALLLCTHVAIDLEEALEYINWYGN